MIVWGILVLALLAGGCTPKVKEVALKRGDNGVKVVKKGVVKLSREDKQFLREEAKRLGMEIPNRKEIIRYMRRMLKNKKSLEIALKRASLYVPHIAPILRKYGLPEELALLPVIESGFNPFAVSRAGAGGIWQLMPQTARHYGLRVDNVVDERFDLIKSTHAAAKYLKDLYELFGDWSLALAAYNCGEGCVMRKTGGIDFWKFKEALPKETRNYVPMFFATLLIAKAPHRYGLKVETLHSPISRRVLRETQSVKTVVRNLKIKESSFRDLNPHIKGDTIPAGTHLYLVKVSQRKLESGSVTVVKKQRTDRKPLEVRKKEKVKTLVLDNSSGAEPGRVVKVIRFKNGAVLYIKD